MSRKNRPYSKRLPKDRTGPWDTIVIGSGMGGMTTAALLAKLGEKVLVLEQHYVPGGFTHTFRRKGWEWDVGVHAVGQVSDKNMPGKVLKALTDGRLEWVSLGPVYDEFYWPEGLRIDFPDRPDTFRENLVAAFPEEEAAIDAYLAEIRSVAAAMNGYWLSRALPRRLASLGDWTLGRAGNAELQRTTADVITSLTDNPKLRAVFAAQWGYYGATPEHSSFAIQALVVQHFRWGAYYPRGGSAEIANTLLQTVSDNGGWTRILADVQEIVVEDGAAVGVRLANDEILRAGKIVSAAGVGATVTRLLPEPLRETDWAQEVAALPPAPAHLCLYIGFKGDITQHGAGSANKWFYQTWDMEWDAWDVGNADALGEAMVLYCSFPSLKDPKHDPGPELLHTGEVVTFVPWEQFSAWRDTAWKKRGEDYEIFKKKIADALLEQFLQQMPGLRPLVAYHELSTPLSTDHFVRPQKGSIYGLSPIPARFATRWLRPKSPIDGLYFSGSEVASVGVVGAMMGGLLAAVTARPLSGVRWLRSVLRR